MEHIQQLTPQNAPTQTTGSPSQGSALDHTFAWMLRIGAVATLFVIPLAAYAM